MVDSRQNSPYCVIDVFSLCYRDTVSLRSRDLCVYMPVGAMFEFNVLLDEVRNCLLPSFIAISKVYRQNVLPGRVCRLRSRDVKKHNVLLGRVCRCGVCMCVLTWARVSMVEPLCLKT